MNETSLPSPAAAPATLRRGLGIGILGRALLGSDRPWDPANRLGLMLLCAALIALFGFFYEHFFTLDNAFTILLNLTSIGIAAFGTTLLIISGNVDLSIGGMYGLIAVVTAVVVRDTQNPLLGISTALILGYGLGYLNGRLVRVLKINPLIVTLGMAAILRGVAYVVTQARSVFGFPDSFTVFGRLDVGAVPFPVIVTGIVYAVGGYILLKTVVGLHIYAIGGNVLSAQLAGVRTQRLVTNLYAINGFLIGVVAVLTIARLGSAQPSIGTQFELDVLTAAILGGALFTGGGGHPLGVIFGVVTIGVLNAGIIFAGVQDYFQQIVKGLVLLIALGFDQYATRRRERARPSEVLDSAGAPGAAGAAAPAEQPGRQSRVLGDTVIAATDLAKSYGAVAAVRGVSFSVAAGEIVCLVGDNGAGKSTVIKMLSGAIEPDSGTIEVRGKPAQLTDPNVARSLGIETAYQDLALCPNLGAAYNLVLGSEPIRFGVGPIRIRDDAKARAIARDRMAELGIVLSDDERPVRLLSGGQRQSVAIARIAGRGVSVVILDEPTAALGVRQTKNVLALIRELARRGAGVIMITHDIDDVFQVADRVVVLRLGRVVHDGPRSELTPIQLVHLMAGLAGRPAAETARQAPAPSPAAAPSGA